MSYENIIMELIVKGGDAKSKALLAINAAKGGDYLQAETLMQECSRTLIEAHEIQTDMIQDELNGKSTEPVNLLMVHSQDHLMNAILISDLAKEFIEIYKRIDGGERK